ncbi:MAG: DegT/DnrJ/EryC1/StrS family aminotransferase, partial [Candidatus Omnitrophota bacterium]|nr:DegT/DnrJ/EryC1/StrS family aminotransferase [Candidatus Omnitrophota bacterium]
MSVIPYARQSISSYDIREVAMALKSDWLTQGPRVKKFEEDLCGYTGSRYAVAVSSGTAALHLSMLAVGMGKGDISVTTPITFSASANCAIYVGSTPEFIDIDDRTCHLDIEKLECFLRVPSQRKKVKVVVPVHFMGTVFDIAGLKKVCDRYGIKIVEDAAHALGAKYKYGGWWMPVGSCGHSDAAIFSFHPIKHITTGEGGAIVTNDRRIYERALKLRHHGIMCDKAKAAWYYDIPEIGFNYRITDFQCALGSSQLKRLDAMVRVRRKLVANYNIGLSSVDNIRLPYERPGTYASYHLYVIRVANDKRNKLYDFLRKNGIYAQVNYIPVHLLAFYRKKFGYKAGDFPVSEKYF